MEDVGKSSSDELSRVTVTGFIGAAKIHILPMATAGSPEVFQHFGICLDHNDSSGKLTFCHHIGSILSNTPTTNFISASKLSLKQTNKHNNKKIPKQNKEISWNFAMDMYLNIYHTQNAFCLELKTLEDLFW